MVRYGIIGGGMMGQEHIRNIALHDGAQVVAVADPDEQMRAAAAGLGRCAGVADYRQLLEPKRCDALVIATPNDTHHAILLDALATELAVMVEKPLCTTVAHCRQAAELAAARAAPVWVAMEYRYMAPIARLLAELRAGTAGQVRMVAIREHRFPFLDKVGGWNRTRARTGGTLVEKCCHFFDLFRLITGSEAVRVYASGAADVNHKDGRGAAQAPDMLDNAYVAVDFASGARTLLDLCMFAEGARWQEEVVATGDTGRIAAQVPSSGTLAQAGGNCGARVAIADRHSRTETEHEIKVDPEILAAGHHFGACYYQHERFLHMLSAGGRPEVSCADGLAAVAIGCAAEQSALSGKPVELEQGCGS